MATTSQDALILLDDRTFLSRLRIVTAFVCREVLAEDTSVAFHNTRARWAVAFLRNSVREIEKVALVAALEPAVVSNSSDAVLLNAIRPNFNIFAGAFNLAPEPTDGVPQEVIVEETDHDNNPATAPIVKRTFRNLFGLLR